MLVTHLEPLPAMSTNPSERQTGRAVPAARGRRCHCGIVAALVAMAWGASPVAAQAAALEVVLRDGSVLAADRIEGDPARGCRVFVGAASHTVPPGALLAVHAAPVAEPALPLFVLTGGDRLHAVVADGDADGERLVVESPVLGRLSLAVDRLATLVADPRQRAANFLLPDGVAEAVFVARSAGIDVLAGTLHRFGPRGVAFAPTGAAGPRWFGDGDYVALRLSGGVDRAAMPWQLLTRTGDRLGAEWRSAGPAGVVLVLEGDHEVTVPLGDLACATATTGVVHLSDLAPKEVAERGFAGEVVFPWRRDRAATGGPLVVQGRAHTKGIGVHAQSRLVFVAPAGATHFWTRVAIDDEALALPFRADAEVRVTVAGRVVFAARGLAPGEAPRDTRLVPVSAGDEVVLEAEFGRARDLGDRVDWLMPVFVLAADRRP